MSSRHTVSAPPILRVEALRKWFPKRSGLFGRQVEHVRAVDDISFEVGRGETLSLVGESGCGKTTAARTLLSLHEPSSGSVVYCPPDGRDEIQLFELSRAELLPLRKELQIVFQDPYGSLNPRMTAGEIVGEGLLAHRMVTRRGLEKRVARILERVGLDGAVQSRYPHEFSGGERQRISIARSIALEPTFLVCDEVLSALDVSIQAQIINLLIDLKEESGLSYLFIAHDLSVVRHISDHVAVMYMGRLVEVGSRQEIFESPAHPYTQALLSAAPRPDPTRKKERILLRGDAPSPTAPPSGCPFRTRCPIAEERCALEYPVEHSLSPTHRAACHLLE